MSALKRRGGIWKAGLALALLSGGLLLAAHFLPFELEAAEGTVYADPDTAASLLFPEEERNLLRLGLTVLKGKSVPGIASWQLRYAQRNSFALTLREEEAVAMLRFEGQYLILAADGAVLKRSNEPEEGLILISGCGISGGEPLSVPEVQDSESYSGLLRYAAAVRRTGVSALSIQAKDGLFYLRFSGVTVKLGTTEYAEEKLRVVRDQEEKFEGLSGTLHLENYEPDALNERYIFEVETGGAN